MEIFSKIAEGFGNTLLIIVPSCILPLLLGVLLTFFASKSPVAAKIFHWLSLPVEAVTPTALLLALYFIPGLSNLFLWNRSRGGPMIVIILTLTLSFIGYMPARYRADFSFLKNLLYNGCGLISTVIKWSTIACLIGVMDILKVFQNIMAMAYDGSYYMFAYCILFGMVFIFELAKRLINQFMK